jgi:hypothetical protein
MATALSGLRDGEEMPLICPTCQLAFKASMPAACYFAWGCFRYFGARTFEGDFSNITRSYAGKGTVRYTYGSGCLSCTADLHMNIPRGEVFGLAFQTNHGSKRIAPGMPEYSVRVPRRSHSAHPRRSWCAKLPPFRKLRSTCPCRINRSRPAGRGKPTTSPSPSNAIARVRRS